MSAFMVSELHLSALVNAANLHRVELLRSPDASKITDQQHTVTVLAVENERSLSARYGDKAGRDGAAMLYRHHHVSAEDLNRPAIAVIKAIECYQYQACEHDGWEDSEAKAWTDRLRAELIGAIPGYSVAPWEVR